ncbi:Asp-tRNA(Asn)/Glu-tRNA(Gln) amidotransferase subunit GatC [Neolewinella litorea]|uniref:Aspartyl/glutamyl-tRNA(Asn/Gln) amidotransferase subunit C n=1 Tax=Neolewinella litorea TaxID=2562452 RepID=A0A4S4NMQ6_9BACT|nr:Asp-tRNA(Asn)/Glu-tRNA(Gln) amidotransferase subunit GatC [Neolewinella litorea]THH41226.1 Asp-tRNA(Asn)/Glu-tRNA(Gln) amidotransferase subunit GatC [Neolewinella litorea]
MTVDDNLVLRLADLAKLDVPEHRVGKLRDDLTRILAMVEKLNELDLDDVEPLRYVTQVEQVLRPDHVGDHLDRTRAMQNAPDSDGVFFRVPRVI